MTLPDPPGYMLEMNAWLKEDGPLNDLQKEYLKLAGALTGDTSFKDIETEYEGVSLFVMTYIHSY